MTLPRIGLGTFRLTGTTVIESVTDALELGYRAIDTAQIYGNEADIGQALAQSALPRDALFLTTKIWTENLSAGALIDSLRRSAEKLRTGHLDLTLIHWPSPGNAVPLPETLDALMQARELGLTRHIGVSNFTVPLLRQSIGHLGAAAIHSHQIELHPWLQNRMVAGFCQAQGIAVTSYMTLGYGQVLADPVVTSIAARHGATPAQVVLAWALRQGYAVIPSSTRRAHLAGNLQADTVQLEDGDMQALAALDRNHRLVNPAGLAPAWD